MTKTNCVILWQLLQQSTESTRTTTKIPARLWNATTHGTMAGLKQFRGFQSMLGSEYNSTARVWFNKIHKCLKSSTKAFSHQMESNVPAFTFWKGPELYLPMYFLKSYSKAPSLRPPLNQTSRDRIRVLHKHLKIRKLFPQKSQAADLSLGAWSPPWHLSWKFNQHWHILAELWFWLIHSLLE